jgi:hypothetical protein
VHKELYSLGFIVHKFPDHNPPGTKRKPSGYAVSSHLWKIVSGHGLAQTFEGVLREAIPSGLDCLPLTNGLVHETSSINADPGTPVGGEFGRKYCHGHNLRTFVEDILPSDDVNGPAILNMAHAFLSDSCVKGCDIIIDNRTVDYSTITLSADLCDPGHNLSVSVVEETNVFKRALSRLEIALVIDSGVPVNSPAGNNESRVGRTPGKMNIGSSPTDGHSDYDGASIDEAADAFLKSALKAVGIQGISCNALIKGWILYKQCDGDLSVARGGLSDDPNDGNIDVERFKEWIAKIKQAVSFSIRHQVVIQLPNDEEPVVLRDFLVPVDLPRRKALSSVADRGDTLLVSATFAQILKPLLVLDRSRHLLEVDADASNQDIEDRANDKLFEQEGVSESVCPWITTSGHRNLRMYESTRARVLSTLSAYPGASIQVLLRELPHLSLQQTELLMHKLVIQEQLVFARCVQCRIELVDPWAAPSTGGGPPDLRYFLA